MTKNKSPFAGFIERFWRKPKGKLGAKLKQVCDDMNPRQRLMAVTVLLSIFILIAFFVFGHACYKIGAKRAVFEYEVQHLHKFDVPDPDSFVKKTIEHNLPEITLDISDIKADAYDDTGMESED